MQEALSSLIFHLAKTKQGSQ